LKIKINIVIITYFYIKKNTKIYKIELLKLDIFVQKYYHYIVQKAKIYNKDNCCFVVEKSNLITYFKELTLEELFEEIDSIFLLHELIFNVICL